MEKEDSGSPLSEREIRRRRLAARSADRMALITGRIKTISPSSSPKCSPRYLQSPSSSPHSHHSRSLSSPFDFSPDQQQSLNLQVGLENELDKPSSTPRKPVSASQVEPQLQIYETKSEATRGAFVTELENKLPPASNVAATLHREPDNMEPKEPDNNNNTVPKESYKVEPLSKPSGVHRNFFTLKDINTCVISSENTRVFCSIMIALLVVLSYMNLPRKIVKSKSVIASTPLYVLMLTDFTIVIARLILEKRRGSERVNEEEEESGDQMDGHNWGGAVKVLEMGIVIHQILRAVFIDCSFYMVIVVCGLSLI